MFIHCIVGRLFGGGMLIFLLIFLLQCGLGGVGRVDRGGEVISLKGFVLVRILNDTIQTHWDLVARVIRTNGFDLWAKRKLSNASPTRQHVMIRMDDYLNSC